MADASTEGELASQDQAFEQTAERHNDDCVICLSPVSERAIAYPCNHCCFDFICLASWVSEQPKCPICKTLVRTIEYDWRSPTDYKIYHVPLPVKESAAKAQRSESRSRSRCRPRARPEQPSAVDIALIRRRNVYRYNLYSLQIGSNRISGFRTITPAIMASSEPMQVRARKWIRRELLVFDGIRQTGPSSPSRRWAAGRVNTAERLLAQLVELLTVVDVRSEPMQDVLVPFIGKANTILFLHELSSWLRSPFADLEGWDRFVQYPARKQQSQSQDVI